MNNNQPEQNNEPGIPTNQQIMDAISAIDSKLDRIIAALEYDAGCPFDE